MTHQPHTLKPAEVLNYFNVVAGPRRVDVDVVLPIDHLTPDGWTAEAEEESCTWAEGFFDGIATETRLMGTTYLGGIGETGFTLRITVLR